MKTNATRQLDKLGIRYELKEYEADPDDLSAVKVAAQVGLPPAQVFKTLLTKGDLHGLALAVIPGDLEVDLKALARASGNRGMEMVPVSQLQHLTGYIRGGVTALACKKPYPVYLDESALTHSVISVSAGGRGLQIFLAPHDYLRAVCAAMAKIARQVPDNPPAPQSPWQRGESKSRSCGP
jgi:Cys-tRNA(Pro)/Cys-tRNA(Cys) deacylase